MIIAGLALLAVGLADLVRQFVRTDARWIGYVLIVAVVLALASIGAAWPAMVAAPLVGALWVWSVPDAVASGAPEGTVRSGAVGSGTAVTGTAATRQSFWPAVVLAVLCVLSVALWGARADAGAVGAIWHVRSPFGPVSYDLAVLAVGVFVFLLESANVIVRAALAGESSEKPSGSFQGGRLIGPLERVLVFLLTLTAAYTLLAAVLAAKGIVRFPEISKGGSTGARAEYFLVGSLVSWVIALGGAFLVWWAAHA